MKRLVLLLTVIVCSPTIKPADSETPQRRTNTMHAEIAAVIHDTAERWNSQDFASVLELWDRDDPEPFYLAEERDDWLIGWAELEAYLDPPVPSPVVEAIREKMSNIRVKPLTEDLAIAVWDMHFEMKMRGQAPIGEDVRVTAALRKRPAGWRYIYYAEAPQTTLVYMRKLFERDVEPGLEKLYKKSDRRPG